MFRRIVRAIAVALATVLGLVIAILGYLSYTRFYRYQGQVDRIVRTIPVDDRAISPAARDVFEKLDGNAMTWIATKCLLNEVAPAQVRMSEWHVRGLVWQLLLPTRLRHDQIMAVYTHCMYFGDGRGVSFGAQHFYRKLASELTIAEAIGLVAIARQPSASPTRHPERFRENLERLTRRYHAAG